MPLRYKTELLLLLAACAIGTADLARAEITLPDSDVLMRAMSDELDRSMKELALDDLPRPYSIQYRAEDRLTFTMGATQGGLLGSNERRSRSFGSRVRVGTYELDNTNVGGGSGARATLPLDDNYVAIRHAIWQATDSDYKRAVEVITRKVAYLKDKTIEDRPDDYSPAEAVKLVEPSARLDFDQAQWEEQVKRLSARFKQHPRIQNSTVDLFAGVVNAYVVNSDGTRLRLGDTGIDLEIFAEIQAEDGMRLSDGLQYIGERIDQLPPIERILADIDKMCEKLVVFTSAEKLEQYTGPVLFEPLAAGKVFEALFADGVCARPIPLGRSSAWGDTSLEKKLGLRVLPRSFKVHDDPLQEHFEDTMLAGAYEYDDEAVPATQVNLVEKGILKNLVASRAPTKKITRSTGHARSVGLSDARATIGCLYINDENGMSPDELEAELIQAAKDEGLEFGLRVVSTDQGGYGNLGSPIYVYKVHVEDGREEPVRGLEFLDVETRALKRILAAGTQRKAYNSLRGIGRSIISPAILMEELELKKFSEEMDKLPILQAPAVRAATSTVTR